MTWTDRQRLELMGLLDDASLDALRNGDHAAAYEAVADACDTHLASSDFIHDNAITELDEALTWLLRWQGVTV